MIKPNGVHRRLVGQIVSRFENTGLYLVQSRVCIPTKEILSRHYAEHANKPFFSGMVDYMSSSQVVAMVWEGVNAVEISRKIVGATNPLKAAPGTIRGDFAVDMGKNIVHCADSAESAKREIEIWFGDVSDVKHFDKDVIYE